MHCDLCCWLLLGSEEVKNGSGFQYINYLFPLKGPSMVDEAFPIAFYKSSWSQDRKTWTKQPSASFIIPEKVSLSRIACGFVFCTIAAGHQVRPNTLGFSSCLHSSTARMATAQHCAGCCVGQCWDLIGAEDTAAPQPQEVHCDPCSTQSRAVKADVERPDRYNLTVPCCIEINMKICLKIGL